MEEMECPENQFWVFYVSTFPSNVRLVVNEKLASCAHDVAAGTSKQLTCETRNVILLILMVFLGICCQTTMVV